MNRLTPILLFLLAHSSAAYGDETLISQIGGNGAKGKGATLVGNAVEVYGTQNGAAFDLKIDTSHYESSIARVQKVWLNFHQSGVDMDDLEFEHIAGKQFKHVKVKEDEKTAGDLASKFDMYVEFHTAGRHDQLGAGEFSLIRVTEKNGATVVGESFRQSSVGDDDGEGAETYFAGAYIRNTKSGAQPHAQYGGASWDSAAVPEPSSFGLFLVVGTFATYLRRNRD